MNASALLLVCVLQAFFIHTSFGVPCSIPPAPCHNAPALPSSGPYYINIDGHDLVIAGKAYVRGSSPIASSVKLAGDLPASGAATIKSACRCGDAYL